MDSRSFLFDAWALADDVVFDVALHKRPVELLPCEVDDFISANVSHVIVQVFEHG